MQKDLTSKLKLFGGISNLGYYMVVYFHSYLLFFILSDVMKLPLAYVATITGISGLVSALLTPASGFIIDRTKAGKHGRYRKLLLLWPMIYILYLWTGYTRLSSNDIVATAILTVCLTFTQFGASLTGAIKNTLLAHISKDSETRALLMGRNTMWGGVGIFVYSLTITSILAFFARFTSTKLSYPLTETFFCLILILTVLIEFSMTKGYDLTANIDTDTGKVRVKDDRPSFKEMMKNVFTNLPLGVQMLTTLCVGLTSGYVSSMLIYYYTYVAESKSLYTLHLTIVSFL